MDENPNSFTKFTKNEVAKIFKETGVRKRTEWFDIILAPKSKKTSRILVITSRKIGNAPKRNQLRRRLKSIFIEQKLLDSAFDCILIAKPGSIKLNFEELKNILLQAYKVNIK